MLKRLSLMVVIVIATAGLKAGTTDVRMVTAGLKAGTTDIRVYTRSADLHVGQQAGKTGSADQQVLQADKDRFAAMVKADIASLTRLLADDLTYSHSNALIQTKAEFIGDLKSGAYDYVSITPSESDYKVRVDGNMAVVTGVAAVNIIDHGKDLKFKIRFISVHRNRAGQWQMIAWQSTRFPS